jgi:hypothetical protein
MHVKSAIAMKKPHHDTPESLESDPVWDLLGHASTRQADTWFAGRVTRAAIQEAVKPRPWWSHLLAPVPAAALAAAVAIVAGVFAILPGGKSDAPSAGVPEAREARIAHIEDVLETEMLLVAVEHMDDYSDEELTALIGF